MIHSFNADPPPMTEDSFSSTFHFLSHGAVGTVELLSRVRHDGLSPRPLFGQSAVTEFLSQVFDPRLLNGHTRHTTVFSLGYALRRPTSLVILGNVPGIYASNSDVLQ